MRKPAETTVGCTPEEAAVPYNLRDAAQKDEKQKVPTIKLNSAELGMLDQIGVNKHLRTLINQDY